MLVQDVTAVFILIAKGSLSGGCVWVNTLIDARTPETGNLPNHTSQRPYLVVGWGRCTFSLACSLFLIVLEWVFVTWIQKLTMIFLCYTWRASIQCSEDVQVLITRTTTVHLKQMSTCSTLGTALLQARDHYEASFRRTKGHCLIRISGYLCGTVSDRGLCLLSSFTTSAPPDPPRFVACPARGTQTHGQL